MSFHRGCIVYEINAICFILGGTFAHGPTYELAVKNILMHG